jgi:hypothetical protein
MAVRTEALLRRRLRTDLRGSRTRATVRVDRRVIITTSSNSSSGRIKASNSMASTKATSSNVNKAIHNSKCIDSRDLLRGKRRSGVAVRLLRGKDSISEP